MRHQRDERTWTSRVTDLNQNWKPLVEGITDAYLHWRYDDSTHAPTEDTTISPLCSDDNAIPPEFIDIEITVIDIYTLSKSVKLSRTDDQTTAVALAGLGFIGNAPFKPSVAVSMKTLKLYRLLRRRKASFSVESFVKVICDLYNVSPPNFLHTPTHCVEQIPYHRKYRRLFGDAFDIYLEVIKVVNNRVKAALGRDAPNWRVLNACPACTYEVCPVVVCYYFLLMVPTARR